MGDSKTKTSERKCEVATMSIDLYQHNKITYDNIEKLFKKANRVGVVQPTGTGKSFLFLKWIEDYPEDNFIIFSPSLEIFNQFEEYVTDADMPDLLSSVAMITYQALNRMNEEEMIAVALKTDKIILDEYHRIGAEQWGPSIHRFLSYCPKAKILGATATPIRYLDYSKDMSFELFDNNLAREMTLGEAVERNILPLPEYIPVWYDIDDKIAQYENAIFQMKNFADGKKVNDILQKLKYTLENSYGVNEIFKKHMPHNHGKFIVFCRDIEHVTEMQSAMTKWLFDVNHQVHSYVTISSRPDKDSEIQKFKDDNSSDAIKLLFSIDRLNEGVHIKGIDGVIMLRPTESPIIYLQQMGRALSAANKEHKPLIFDMVNNYLNVKIHYSDGRYMNVFEKEFCDAVIKYQSDTVFRVYEKMIEFNALFDEIESYLWFSNDKRWEKNFVLLQAYYNENGKFPHANEVYHEINLGKWCYSQKQLAKKENYPLKRYNKLKELGFSFTTADYNAQWEQNYIVLQQFIKEIGRIPQKGEIYQNVKIGNWCDRQKTLAKNKTLPLDRLEKINAAGLFTTTNEAVWNTHFLSLQEFVAEFNRFPKKSEHYQNFNLGKWWQIEKSRIKKGNYPEYKLSKLQNYFNSNSFTLKKGVPKLN